MCRVDEVKATEAWTGTLTHATDSHGLSTLHLTFGRWSGGLIDGWLRWVSGR